MENYTQVSSSILKFWLGHKISDGNVAHCGPDTGSQRPAYCHYDSASHNRLEHITVHHSILPRLAQHKNLIARRDITSTDSVSSYHAQGCSLPGSSRGRRPVRPLLHDVPLQHSTEAWPAKSENRLWLHILPTPCLNFRLPSRSCCR